MTREDDREREQTLFQHQAVIVHGPWGPLRHSGMVKMQLTQLGRFELYRQESVGRRAFSASLLNRTSAFDSRILHQKVQFAREDEC